MRQGRRTDEFYYTANRSPFITNDLLTIWFSNSVDSSLSLFQKKMITQREVRSRNISIIMYFCQFGASIIRAGLFPIRRYILSIVLNIFLLIFSGIGLIGAIRMSPIMIFVHYGAVMIELIIMFIMLVITMTKTDNEGQLFVIYLPIIIDVIWMAVLTYTGYVLLNWLIFMEKVERQNRLSNNGVVINIDPMVGNNANSNVQNNASRSEASKNDREFMGIAPHDQSGGEFRGLNPDAKCCVCYTSIPEVLFYKCGHFICCKTCGDNLKSSRQRCPICRAEIKDVLKVYT